MSAAEADQGVGGKGEADQASRHLQVGVEERVRLVAGVAQNPEGNEKCASGDRPKEDEAEAMKKTPKAARTSHNSPNEYDTCPRNTEQARCRSFYWF